MICAPPDTRWLVPEARRGPLYAAIADAIALRLVDGRQPVWAAEDDNAASLALAVAAGVRARRPDRDPEGHKRRLVRVL